MKVYLFCPVARTGGPENIHQLCDCLNILGIESYIVYLSHAPIKNIYQEYNNVRVSEYIEDVKENIFIFPEIYKASDFNFKQIRLAVWWLSYDNASLEAREVNKNVKIHLYQSYYAQEMVGIKGFMIGDYINDEFVFTPTEKQDIVCCNGVKDKITPDVCKKLGIHCISISGMTKQDVMNVLKMCKVYVDQGGHPGKDRIPREAALMNCVVVTNRKGSAGYDQDVDIDEKFDDCENALVNIMSNYDVFFKKQKRYRNKIKNEKMDFFYNVNYVFKKRLNVL